MILKKRVWHVLLAVLMIHSADALFAQVFTPPSARPPMNFNFGTTWTPVPLCSVQVFMKTGQIIRDTAKINYGFMSNSLEHKGTTITPPQTDSIIADGFVGIPENDEWFWRTIPGKLSVYTGERDIGAQDYKYFQKGIGPVSLTPFSTGALEKAVADNPEAMKCVRAYRTGKIVYISMMVAGVGLAGFGLLTNSPTSPIQFELFGGGAIFVCSAIPYFMTRNKLRKGIDTYNE